MELLSTKYMIGFLSQNHPSFRSVPEVTLSQKLRGQKLQGIQKDTEFVPLSLNIST